ncbi:hypothetical protein L9F63_013803, partial [Diploptera punctata]
MYLSQFGYFNSQARSFNSGAMVSEDSIRKAIAEFQAFAGLDITGELDNETKETMSLPRCGVKDKVGYASDTRSKRYALQGSRWRVKELSYRISKYPSNLAASKVDPEIERAFKIWSDVSGLNFVKKDKGQVHIEVRFEKGEHGDGDPFDGPSGTLAHAFFPVYGGDAHFDDTEPWSVRSYRGTNLFQVAAHEFGHSLGLSHSDVKTALMAPFYRGYEPYFQLDDDDIQGIQALYGKPTAIVQPGSVAPTTTTSTRAPVVNTRQDDELCNDGTVDTILTSPDGNTYAFKGEHYWMLTDTGVAPGYPRLISDNWPGLPAHIDAAFTYRNGKTYFFKDSEYWRYVGSNMDGDYPKRISDGFNGIPDNIDAALVWSGNGKIYFYKGSKFWRYDPSQKPPVKSVYPKPISNWEGIPDNLDSAVQYTNGYTYFFKKGQYYRFNDRSFSVDAAVPPFPRSAGTWWFGCKDKPNETAARDSSRKSSLGDNNDPHKSDVDDLILDAADANNQPHDEGRTGARRSGSESLTSNLSSAITSLVLSRRSSSPYK